MPNINAAWVGNRGCMFGAIPLWYWITCSLTPFQHDSTGPHQDGACLFLKEYMASATFCDPLALIFRLGICCPLKPLHETLSCFMCRYISSGAQH